MTTGSDGPRTSAAAVQGEQDDDASHSNVVGEQTISGLHTSPNRTPVGIPACSDDITSLTAEDLSRDVTHAVEEAEVSVVSKDSAETATIRDSIFEASEPQTTVLSESLLDESDCDTSGVDGGTPGVAEQAALQTTVTVSECHVCLQRPKVPNKKRPNQRMCFTCGTKTTKKWRKLGPEIAHCSQQHILHW